MCDLHYELVVIDKISSQEELQMYALMEDVYQKVSLHTFKQDLNNKHYCGLLRDPQGVIRGFTTYRILSYKTEKYSLIHILYSGDTVIQPAFWGSQELVKGFCNTVGKLKSKFPDEPLYWYLMSKGHRTYMYLPLFFKEYHPSIHRHSEKLADIADMVSTDLYPQFWQKSNGIIEFNSSLGELRADFAQTSFSRSSNKHVKFFLSKNPEFSNGNELVCIAEISGDNFRGLARKIFNQSLEVLEPSPEL